CAIVLNSQFQVSSTPEQATSLPARSTLHPALLLSSCPFGVSAMALKYARRREFAQLVPDHVLLNINRYVLTSVVNTDGMSDHFREDRRTTAPRFDDSFFTARVHL